MVSTHGTLQPDDAVNVCMVEVSRDFAYPKQYRSCGCHAEGGPSSMDAGYVLPDQRLGDNTWTALVPALNLCLTVIRDL